jgi:hypothetical protein
MRTRRHHSSNFEPSDYSHLRAFLCGYLHEDWPDEYGSVSEAVEKFWMDTGTASIARVAAEWQKLRQISGGKLNNTMELLGQLGGAWNPTSQKQVVEMTDALAKHGERGGRK